MNEHIYDLINQGEHQTLDFKHSITDSKKIARSLAAFANTNGGRLLVGVRDNRSIAGVKSDEEFYMVQAAADMYCKPGNLKLKYGT
jgi:predicted HTH transcriptional regulator